MSQGPQAERLIGESPSFLEVLELTSQIAPLNKPLLIVGERGTGKELIAARLHYLSGRWDQEYLKMNCAAISETLLESELFGHEVGSFTGAQKLHRGRFERADKGTLFLDELANTSQLVQEKLLRIIEYGEFERVGGSKTIITDIRLIAATNEDLPALARKGAFREDLLDRLAFDVITLPPLRARPEDILILAEHFAVSMAIDLGREYFPGFTPAARKVLRSYHWPGNVRELKNVVERSVYRNQALDAPVDLISLDPFDSPFRPTAANQTLSVSSTPDASDHTTTVVPPVPSVSDFPIDFRQSVQDYEVGLIKNALASNQFNQKKTAEALGVTYHQLRGYLKKYDLLESA
ncbi:MAG: phage shock protein operon transcriptional activator [bacterium]|nr:phage shock protein operon transcriptional activator [Gammaproteobacteria bacterium]HIL97619.1 phage shock protein operon transcriptional activator [Pseudomonadales bacterium]